MSLSAVYWLSPPLPLPVELLMAPSDLVDGPGLCETAEDLLVPLKVELLQGLLCLAQRALMHPHQFPLLLLATLASLAASLGSDQV